MELIYDPLNPAPHEIMSAAAYIENFRNNGFPSKDPEQLSEQEKALYADRFLRIMAARNVAGSERHKKDRLVRLQVNSFDVDSCAQIMKDDPTFQKFLQTLMDDPKKMKAAISAATKRPGHGGGLDDMFKEFVRNRPPSQLRNDNIMERYLPTAKERLEILKKQAALKLYDPALIAAEMIQLRNLAHADKGRKESLDKKIPVRRHGEELSSGSIALAENAQTRALLGRKEVVDLIADGHGGKMMDTARRLAQTSLDPEKCEDQLELLNANTIGVRMKQIEKDALELKAELSVAMGRRADTEALMRKSKLLIAEYMLLDKKSRDPKTDEVDEAALQNDVPWLSVEKIRRKGPENNDAFRKLFENITAEEMSVQLGNINRYGQRGFRSSLADRQNEILLQDHGLPKDFLKRGGDHYDDAHSELDDGYDVEDDFDDGPESGEGKETGHENEHVITIT